MLLTVDDVAKRWQVTRDYAQRYIVKLPEFPQPAPGSTRKNQRWREQDVDAFLAGTTITSE
jgi:predicted DNA-binding transcriptional regulator AlpA